MSPGRVIAVVGPSGVGKDSVMQGLAEAEPSFVLARRTITRPAHEATEAFDPITPEDFDAALAAGAFCLHWGAHDLRYGIPRSVARAANAGQDTLINLSRGVLKEAAEVFADFTVLSLTATPETLAERLAARGRESETSVRKRLSRTGAPLPGGLCVIEISNDGPLGATISAARTALDLALA